MACCSPAKTEQVESKKVETVKAVANAFAEPTWCLTPQTALPRRLTACGAGLLTSSCILTFWISGTPDRRDAQ